MKSAPELSEADVLALEALESLDATPERFDAIPHIRGEKRTSGDLASLKRVLEALPTNDTQTLIVRLETTDDPLKLWGLHVELNGRGIAPALRWPANTGTTQTRFITIMADLLWTATQYPDQRPLFKGWQELFKLTPNCDEWHDKAFWILKAMRNSNLAQYGSKGLALVDAQRLELMMFQTPAIRTARTRLQPEKFEQIGQQLYEHAANNPDKSGARTTEAIATSRARLLRVAILTGNSPIRIKRNWELLTGEARATQVISRQLAGIKKSLDLRG
jgi:hypothetical protein